MTQPIAVLCFRAGDVRVAVAAGAVAGIVPAQPGLPHVRTLVGDRQDGVAPMGAEHAAGRAVRLRVGAASADLLVDGPLRVHSVGVADVVPASGSLDLAKGILGFARLDGELVLLLDAARLVERAASGART